MASLCSAAQAVLLFAAFGAALRPPSLLQVETNNSAPCNQDEGETPSNCGSSFCTRDPPIDFPGPYGETGVWQGKTYGKGVSKAECTLACRGVSVNALDTGVGRACSVAKYHAGGRYCWLMPPAVKPCTESEMNFDMSHGWNYYVAMAFGGGASCGGRNDGCSEHAGWGDTRDGCCPEGLGEGDGDCDANSDCMGGLICGQHNCADTDFIRRSPQRWLNDAWGSFDLTDDCCVHPKLWEYHNPLGQIR